MDAVKEFGIRAKDGSDGTSEAFKSLGLNSEKISADFAAGGEKGKAAFELVTSKLNEMKDPLEQNKVGTALFGKIVPNSNRVKSVKAKFLICA